MVRNSLDWRSAASAGQPRANTPHDPTSDKLHKGIPRAGDWELIGAVIAVRIIGGLVLAAGLWLLAWSLWSDRSRGRRRCPQCWYDMMGIAPAAAAANPAHPADAASSTAARFTCPECGRIAASERAMLRTRRKHWRGAVGVAVVVFGVCLVLVPEIRRTVLVSWLPRPVLIALMVGLETEPGALFAEAASRAQPKSAPACFGWSAWEVKWLVAHTGRLIASPRSARSPAALGDLRYIDYRPPSSDEPLYAIWMLSWLGTAASPAIPDLLNALDDQTLLLAATQTLATVGRGNDRVVRALAGNVEASSEPNHEELIEALEAVAITPDQLRQAEDSLRAALRVPIPKLQKACLITLSKRKDFFVDAEVFTAEVAFVAAFADAELAEFAYGVLGRLGEPGGRELARVIRSTDLRKAESALKVAAMYAVKTPEVSEAAAATLGSGTATSLRWRAVSTLSCIAKRDAALFSLLSAAAERDTAPEVRNAALWALRQTAPPDTALAAAVKGLADQDKSVRGAAIGVMVYLARDHADAAEGVAAARGHADPEVAEMARQTTATLEELAAIAGDR